MIKGINDNVLSRELEKEFAEEEKKIDEEEAKMEKLSPSTAGRSARMSSAALKSALQKKKEEIKNNGSNNNNDLVLIKNTTSLLYRFESCGFNYQKQMNSKNITYRDIEKVLILFRNSYSVDK